MALGTNFNYTYDGKLSTEVFLNPALESPEIKSLFQVRRGIRFKEQINTAGPLDRFVLADNGNCNQAPQGDKVNITNRTIDMERLKYWLDQCADDFKGNIMNEALKTGKDINDLTGTEIDRLIQSLISQGLRNDLFRIFSFGDKNSADVNYNQMNGS